MITVCLPSDAAVAEVGDIDGVRVVVWDGRSEPPADLAAVEFLVGRYASAPPDRTALEALPALRVVQLTSAGVEPWLDRVPDGVTLCSGRGVHGASTAELAVAGLIAVVRDLPHYVHAQRAGEWAPRSTRSLSGMRVAVLGAGDIGNRVATALRAFDADVTLYARTARDGVRALADLTGGSGADLGRTDAVVIALPATAETARLVDARFLSALPDGAAIVNVARGAIVDTDALLAELTARRLHAFLDVTDPEPLPAGHALWSAPNLLLTPHVGGGTAGWERRAYALVREQILRFQRGEPLLNRVRDGF